MQSHAERTDDRKSRSFSSPKLQILPLITFNSPIESCDHLIFLHPPKTGGTNLSFIADALGKTNPLFKSTRFSVPRNDQSPALITEHWIGGLKSVEKALQNNPNACKGWHFISGHFPLGLHEDLDVPAKYITLIRNPIDRAVSSTNFDYQRGYISQEHAENYLLSAEIDNPQTRMLAGKKFMSGICTAETFEMAIKNIENHFLLAAVTEDTNTFIQVLATIQNWGPLALAKNQVTGDKAIQHLDARLLETLTHKHQYDLQLYHWVKQRWQLWKEQNIHAVQDISAQKILCITSDFANTRQPILMTEQEVAIHNKSLTEELIEISQNHSGLKKIASNHSALKFFGLKNPSGDHMALILGRHSHGYSPNK